MDYIDLYVNFLKSFLKIRFPLKIVFDCSNGTTGPILKKLFQGQKKIKAVFINTKPDGRFPAHGPNPLKRGAKRQIESQVAKTRSDIGVIFDADGDRVFFIDNKGRPVDTDVIIYLLAPLFKPPFLIDVSEGALPLRWLAPKLKVIETRTGHYFIKKAMRRKKIDFAAEHSGHYYFKKFYYADSGIIAAVLTANQTSFLKEKKLPLSTWIESLPKHYLIEDLSLKIKKHQDFLNMVKKFYRKKKAKVVVKDGLTVTGGDFWINMRPSNTEPVVRVSLEGKTHEAVCARRAEILSYYKKSVQNNGQNIGGLI